MLKRTVTLLADPVWFIAVRQWWTLGVLVVVVLLAEYVGLLGTFRSGVERLWQTVIIPVNHVSLALWRPIAWIGSEQARSEETTQLRARYNQTLVALTEMEAVRQENETLKRLLASQSASPRSVVLGVPIMAYGRPLVAAGSDQGVVTGMSVLVEQTLVGVISDVSRNQAAVELITQETGPRVLAKTENGITGVVHGDGKRVVMSEIPIDSKVLPGERIMTQGQAGIQPNTLIGTIAQVKAEPSASVQTAIVVQLVSFYETTLVEIE